MSSVNVKKQVTKEMTIASIIEKFPYAADSLKARGIHCVGCGVSSFETLEQGVLGHGRLKEELDEILEEINSTIEEMSGAIFVITERASKVILETMAEEDDEYIGLKIKVNTTCNCSFEYHFKFVKDFDEEDHLLEQHSLKVAIDKESLPLIKGTRMDYVMSVQGAGLKLSNPNSPEGGGGGCGCSGGGSSFS